MADPDFATAGKIDIILGADVYRALRTPGERYGPLDAPLAQNTIFGWILTGRVADSKSTQAERGVRVYHCSTGTDLSGFVRQFWELEELPNTKHLTEEEKCEAIFQETHRRE